MNLQEIITEVNKNVDDDLEQSDVIGWVNRCLEELTMYANAQTITTIPLIADQNLYDMPSDLIEVVQVVQDGSIIRQLPLNNLTSDGFKLLNGNRQLLLQPTPTDGSLDIYYKASLPQVSDLDDVPHIPTFFHDIFIYYVMMKFKYQEQDAEYMNYAISEYEKRKTDFRKYINKQQNAVKKTVDVYRMGWR